FESGTCRPESGQALDAPWSDAHHYSMARTNDPERGLWQNRRVVRIHSMNRLRSLIGMLPALLALAAAGSRAAEALPVIELRLGAHTVRAEVAATEPARTLGLMHRKNPLAANRGMLFVF